MSSLNNIVKSNKGYEIGHISHRKDGDYKKVGKGEWRKIEEGEGIGKEKETDEGSVNDKEKSSVIIKRGLKKTEDITDYMEKKLNEIGYEVERKHSGLSGSEYLILKNIGDLFGKDKVDDVEIRIADHNLPPSYDKKYQGDFDIMSNGKQRNGTNGDATNYENVLNILAHKKGLQNTSYDTFLSEKKNKDEETKIYWEQFHKNKDEANKRRKEEAEILLNQIKNEKDKNKKLILAENAYKAQMKVGSFYENIISGQNRNNLRELIKQLN